MDSEFSGKRKKRIFLWGQVLQKMKDVYKNLPFSRDDITRKYLNMMTTYKRIKKRNNRPGEAATSWDFFDQFDEVYGSRFDNMMIPESDLKSSLSSLITELKHEHLANDDDNDSGGSSPPPRKRARSDILEFLRAESESDKKILKELLQCEKEKLKLEREKVEEIKKLRKAFEAISK